VKKNEKMDYFPTKVLQPGTNLLKYYLDLEDITIKPICGHSVVFSEKCWMECLFSQD